MMTMTYILDWPFEINYFDLNGAIFRGEPLFLKKTKQQLSGDKRKCTHPVAVGVC